MTAQSKRRNLVHAGQDLLTQAKRIADASDRVFVGMARGVGQLGTWPRRRAPESEDRPRLNLRAARLDRLRSSPLTDPRTRQTLIDSPDDGQDLGAPAGQSCPAGVVPVVRALADVVESHGGDGYTSLAADDRFWSLIRLLQALADGNSRLELAPAHRADSEPAVDIHVEEDLSQLERAAGD